MTDSTGASPSSPSTPRDPEGRRAPPSNWHPHLPEPPSGFPQGKLSVGASTRGCRVPPGPNPGPTSGEPARPSRGTGPRQLTSRTIGRGNLPILARSRPFLQGQLHDAKLFAVCMHGAALLYNLMLSERQRHEQRIEIYCGELEKWAADAAALEADLADWQLHGVWQVAWATGRSPSFPMQIFVQRWVENLKRRGSEARRPRQLQCAKSGARTRDSAQRQSRAPDKCSTSRALGRSVRHGTDVLPVGRDQSDSSGHL